MAIRRFEKRKIIEKKKEYALIHCPLGYPKCIRERCKYFKNGKCSLGCVSC